MITARFEIGRARIVCTDRHGGRSAAPFDTLNLGDHVGDEPPAVASNRAALARDLGLAREPYWLRQVHGCRVVYVGAGADAGGRVATPREPPVADAALTDAAGVPVAVLTADCAPIAIVGGRAVAVIHAGWAGLLAGVVGATVEAVARLDPGPLRAVLGPCVQPSSYEFGPADLGRLVDRFGPAVAGRTSGGSAALDLPRAVRSALREAGVERVDDVGVCTYASPDHFSYRRDGRTGRQALVAWVDG
ncbi:MAG: polyphenol oxidase family protein [Acidimicrobiia bacterium]